MLYAEGFKFAKIVGRKLVEIFNLSRQLLSPQRHYDWGLRALKTILGHAGQLVSKERKETKGELTLETETKLIIGALRINTLSKLTFADTSRYITIPNPYPVCAFN
jgi:dynein heavy chain 2